MESITLNIYPGYKNSLMILDLDYLRLPEDIDWRTLKVRDDKGRDVIFDLVNFNNKKNNFSYKTDIKENTLVIILNKDNIRNLKITYSKTNKKTSFKHQKNKINLENKNFLEISTKNVSIKFEKKFFSISNFKINNDNFGPLQLVTSGGRICKQNSYMKNIKFDILADSPIIKVIKITGEMPVLGNKVDSEGYLPLEMIYYFWSCDNKNIFSKVEINLLYELAKSKEGKKLPYLEPLIWYMIDNKNKVKFNSLFVNKMDNSKIVTLKKPYYAYVQKKRNTFMMAPYLALPNDGLHIETSEKWFGAAWHSLSSKKKPYWVHFFKDEEVKIPQGYYPAHSLNAYWKIGLFFGIGKTEDIAKIYTYPAKIRSTFHESDDIGNPFITHWPNNAKLALNVITDDGKANDYLWRKNNTIPWDVQIALPTRKLFGVSYSRYCFLKNKLFFIEKYPLLSTVVSTLLSFFGIGLDYKKKLVNIKASLVPHTNTHPVLRESSSGRVRNEIKTSEKIWIKDFKLPIPLSHIFSYHSSYGLATKEGTRQAVAFSASINLQWIREWPIPNVPVDFFLPTKLYWGITSGGDLGNKKVCENIKSEFNNLYRNGADYMQVTGHLPDIVKKQGPPYLKKLFQEINKTKDVWIANADDIIKYYKCRENIFLGRIYEENNFFIVPLIKDIPPYFNTEITMVQKIKENVRIEQSSDGEIWKKIKFRYLDKKQNLVLYSFNSKSSFIRFKK